MTPNGRIISMKKSAMLMGILGLGIIFNAGSSFAQDTATPKGSSATQGSTASKGSATSKGPATGRKALTPAKKTAASSPVVLNDQKDRLSYALGMNMGTNLHSNLQRDAIDVDPNVVLQGIKDAMTGGKLLMTEAEAHAALMDLQKTLMTKQ